MTLAGTSFEKACIDVLVFFPGLECLTLKGGFSSTSEGTAHLPVLLRKYKSKLVGLSVRLSKFCPPDFTHAVLEDVFAAPMPRLGSLLLECCDIEKAISSICTRVSFPALRFLSLRTPIQSISLANARLLLACRSYPLLDIVEIKTLALEGEVSPEGPCITEGKGICLLYGKYTITDGWEDPLRVLQL